MTLNNRFVVEFIIFDKEKTLSDSEINQKNEDMNQILNMLIYKNLNFNKETNINQHSIFFYTEYNINFYIYEDIKKIVREIKKEIETYINKKIYTNISMEVTDTNGNLYNINKDTDSEQKSDDYYTLHNIDFVI